MYDVAILGTGPAGLSAAIYCARYALKLVVIGRDLGMLIEAHKVDNYLGYWNISGYELAKKFSEHVEHLGIKIVCDEIKSIIKDKNFITNTTQSQYISKTVIYALGSIKRKLGLEEEEKYIGKGLSYCAICDAPFFKDKTVAVIGSGNTAIEAALLLSKYTKKVYLICRGNKLNSLPYLIDKLEDSKITIIFNTVIKKINGKFVQSVVLEDSKGNVTTLNIDGIFVEEFGRVPNSKLAKDIGIEVNEMGRIKVMNTMATNVSGFFAAGNVTTGSNEVDQVVTAVGEGSIAASSVFNYVNELRKENYLL